MPILCFVVGWYRASGGSSYFAVAPLYAPQLACRLLQGCETLLTFRCTSSRIPVYPASYDVRVMVGVTTSVTNKSKDVLAQLQYRNQSVRHLMLFYPYLSAHLLTQQRARANYNQQVPPPRAAKHGTPCMLLYRCLLLFVF